MNFRTMAFAALAAVAFGTSAVSFAQSTPGPQGTPPPPPVPSALPSAEPAPALPSTTPTPEPFPSPTVAPEPSSSPAGRGGHRHHGPVGGAPSPAASASETPEPPQFSTLDGVWEVALQPLNGARTIYSHLYVKQDGNTLSGTWRRRDVKSALPFSGTFDGRLFKLVVTNGALSQTLSGYAENYMDMVGLFTDGDPKHAGIPFTAGHRKSTKERERDAKPDEKTDDKAPKL